MAKITFHYPIGQDIISDAGIGASQGAELAIDALVLVPADAPPVDILGKSAGRAVHDALRLPALPAEGDSVKVLLPVLGNPDPRVTKVRSPCVKPRARFNTLHTAVAFILMKSDGLVTRAHEYVLQS